MNSVKLQHIKCCIFQFFNSPVALKDLKHFWPPQEKVEMMPLFQNQLHPGFLSLIVLLFIKISDLLTIQPTRSTRSSAVVTLQRPSNPSRLKISDRSFYFQVPALWNALPHHLRSHSHSSQSHSLLSLSSSQFHKQLKTHLFLHSYPP